MQPACYQHLHKVYNWAPFWSTMVEDFVVFFNNSTGHVAQVTLLNRQIDRGENDGAERDISWVSLRDLIPFCIATRSCFLLGKVNKVFSALTTTHTSYRKQDTVAQETDIMQVRITWVEDPSGANRGPWLVTSVHWGKLRSLSTH